MSSRNTVFQCRKSASATATPRGHCTPKPCIDQPERSTAACWQSDHDLLNVSKIPLSERLRTRSRTYIDEIKDKVPKPPGTVPAGFYPSWQKIPLDKKIPNIPAPEGAIVYTRGCLGTKLHRRPKTFSVHDPNHTERVLTAYESLHDPHAQSYYCKPEIQQLLRKQGLVTRDGQVICSQKEFNCYREYLCTLYNQRLEECIKNDDSKLKEGHQQSRELKFYTEVVGPGGKRQLQEMKRHRMLQAMKRKRHDESKIIKEKKRKEECRKKIYARNQFLQRLNRAIISCENNLRRRIHQVNLEQQKKFQEERFFRCLREKDAFYEERVRFLKEEMARQYKLCLTEWALAKCSYQIAHQKHEEFVSKSLQHDHRRRTAKRRHHYEKLQERQALRNTRSSRKKKKQEVEKFNERIEYLSRKYFDIWCQHVQGKKILCNDTGGPYKSVWDVTDAMQNMNDFLLRTCKNLDRLKSRRAIEAAKEGGENEMITSTIAFLSKISRSNRRAPNWSANNINDTTDPKPVTTTTSSQEPKSIRTTEQDAKSKLGFLLEPKEKRKPPVKSIAPCDEPIHRLFQPCRRSKVYDLTCGGCYPLERWRATDCHGMYERPSTPMPCCFQKAPCTVCYEEPCNPCRTVKPVSLCNTPEGACFKSACMDYLKDENMLDCSAPKCGTGRAPKCSTQRTHKRKAYSKSVATPMGRCMPLSPRLVCDLNKPCKKRPRKRTCTPKAPPEEESKCPPIRTGHLSRKCQVPPISSHPLFKTGTIKENFTQTKPRIPTRPRKHPTKDAGTRTTAKKFANSYTEPVGLPSPAHKDTQTPAKVPDLKPSKLQPRSIKSVPVTTASQTDPKHSETISLQTSPVPMVTPALTQTSKPPETSPTITQTERPVKVSPETTQTAPPKPKTLVPIDTQTNKPAKVSPEYTQTVTENVPKPAQTEPIKAANVSPQTESVPEKVLMPQPTQMEPRPALEKPVQAGRGTPGKTLPEQIKTSQTDPSPTKTPNLTQTVTIQFFPQSVQTDIKEPMSQPSQTKPINVTPALGQTDPIELDSAPVQVQTESFPPTKVYPQITQTPAPPTPAKVHPEAQQTDPVKTIPEEAQTDPKRMSTDITQTPKPIQELDIPPEPAKVVAPQHLEVQTEKQETIPQPTQTEKLKLSPHFSQTVPPPSTIPETIQTDPMDLTPQITQTKAPPDTIPQPTQTEYKPKELPASTQYEPKEPIEQPVQTKPTESSPKLSQTEPLKTPSPKPAEAQTPRPPISTPKPTQTASPHPKPMVTQTPVKDVAETKESHAQPEPIAETTPKPSQTEPKEFLPQQSQATPEYSVPQPIQTEPRPGDTQPSQTEPAKLTTASSQPTATITITTTIQTEAVPSSTQQTQGDPKATTENIVQTEPPIRKFRSTEGLPGDLKSGTVQTDPPPLIPEGTQSEPIENSPAVIQTEPGTSVPGMTQSVPAETNPLIVQTEPIQVCPEFVQCQPQPPNPAAVQTVVTVTRLNCCEPEPPSPSQAGVQTESVKTIPEIVQAEPDLSIPAVVQTDPSPVMHFPTQTYCMEVCTEVAQTHSIQVCTSATVATPAANSPVFIQTPLPQTLGSGVQSEPLQTTLIAAQTDPSQVVQEYTQAEPREIIPGMVQTTPIDCMPEEIQTDASRLESTVAQTDCIPSIPTAVQNEPGVTCETPIQTDPCEKITAGDQTQPYEVTPKPAQTNIPDSQAVPAQTNPPNTATVPEQTDKIATTPGTVQNLPTEIASVQLQTESVPNITNISQTDPSCSYPDPSQTEDMEEFPGYAQTGHSVLESGITQTESTEKSEAGVEAIPSKIFNQPQMSQTQPVLTAAGITDPQCIPTASDTALTDPTQTTTEPTQTKPSPPVCSSVVQVKPCMTTVTLQSDPTCTPKCTQICPPTVHVETPAQCVPAPASAITQTPARVLKDRGETCDSPVMVPRSACVSICSTPTTKVSTIVTHKEKAVCKEKSMKYLQQPHKHTEIIRDMEEPCCAQTQVEVVCCDGATEDKVIVARPYVPAAQHITTFNCCTEKDSQTVVIPTVQSIECCNEVEVIKCQCPSEHSVQAIVCVQSERDCQTCETPCTPQSIQTGVPIVKICTQTEPAESPKVKSIPTQVFAVPRKDASQSPMPPTEECEQTALPQRPTSGSQTGAPPNCSQDLQTISAVQECVQTVSPTKPVNTSQTYESPSCPGYAQTQNLKVCIETQLTPPFQTSTSTQLTLPCIEASLGPGASEEQGVQTVLTPKSANDTQTGAKQTDSECLQTEPSAPKICEGTELTPLEDRNVPTQVWTRNKEASQEPLPLNQIDGSIQTSGPCNPINYSQTTEAPCSSGVSQTENPCLQICIEKQSAPPCVICSSTQVTKCTREDSQGPAPPQEQCIQHSPLPSLTTDCQTSEHQLNSQGLQTEPPSVKVPGESSVKVPGESQPMSFDIESTPTQTSPSSNENSQGPLTVPTMENCVQTPSLPCKSENPSQTIQPSFCVGGAQTETPPNRICFETQLVPPCVSTTSTQIRIPMTEASQGPAGPGEQCLQTTPEPQADHVCQMDEPTCDSQCFQTDPPTMKICVHTESAPPCIQSTLTQVSIPTREISQGPMPSCPADQTMQTESSTKPENVTQTDDPTSNTQNIETDQTTPKVCAETEHENPEIQCTSTEILISTKDASQDPSTPQRTEQSAQTPAPCKPVTESQTNESSYCIGGTQTDAPTARICIETQLALPCVKATPTQICVPVQEAEQGPPAPTEQGIQTVLEPKLENVTQTINATSDTECQQTDLLVTTAFAETEADPPYVNSIPTQIFRPTTESSEGTVPHCQEEHSVQTIHPCKPLGYSQTGEIETSFDGTQTEIPVSKLCVETQLVPPDAACAHTQSTIPAAEASQGPDPCEEQSLQTDSQSNPENVSQTTQPPCEAQCIQIEMSQTKVCAETETMKPDVISSKAQALISTKESAQGPSPPAPAEQCVQASPPCKPVICCQTADAQSDLIGTQTETPAAKICIQTQLGPTEVLCAPAQTILVTVDAAQGVITPAAVEQCVQTTVPPGPVVDTQTCKPPCYVQTVQTAVPCLPVMQCQTYISSSLDGTQTDLPPSKICAQTQPLAIELKSTPTQLTIITRDICEGSVPKVAVEQCAYCQICPPPKPANISQTTEPVCSVQLVQTEMTAPEEKSFQSESVLKSEDCSQTPCPPETVQRGEGKEPPGVVGVQTCDEPPPLGFSQTDPTLVSEQCTQTNPTQPNAIESQTVPSKSAHITTTTCPPCLQEECEQTEGAIFDSSIQTERPCEEAEIVQTDPTAESCSQVDKVCEKDELSQRSTPLEAAAVQTDVTPCLEQCIQNEPALKAEEIAQTCPPPAAAVSAQTEVDTIAGQTEKMADIAGFTQTYPPCPSHACLQTLPPCLAIHCTQTIRQCPIQACAQTPVVLPCINSVQTDGEILTSEDCSQTQKSCVHVECSQTISSPMAAGNAQTEFESEITETDPISLCPESAQTETPELPQQSLQTESPAKVQDFSQTPCPPVSVHRGQGKDPPGVICVQTCYQAAAIDCVQTDSPVAAEQCSQTVAKLPNTVELQIEICKPQMVTVSTCPPSLESEHAVQTHIPGPKICAQTEPKVVSSKCIPTQITPQTKEACHGPLPPVPAEQCVQTVLSPKPENISQTCEPPCDTQCLQTDQLKQMVCATTEPVPLAVKCTPTQIVIPTKEIEQGPSPPPPVEQCVQTITSPKPVICCQTIVHVPCLQNTQTEALPLKVCAETDAAASPAVKSTPTQIVIPKAETFTEPKPLKPADQCIQICTPPNPAIVCQTCGPCCLVCVQTDSPTHPVICCQTCRAPCCSQTAQASISTAKVCVHTWPEPPQVQCTPTQMTIRTKETAQSPAPPVSAEQCIQICAPQNPESISQTCAPTCYIESTQTQAPRTKVCAETQPEVRVKCIPTQMELPTKETSQGPEPPLPVEQCHQTEVHPDKPIIQTQTCKPPCCIQALQTIALTLPVIECQTCLPCCLEATQTDLPTNKVCVETQQMPPEVVCTPTQMTIPVKETSQGPSPPAKVEQCFQICAPTCPAVNVQTCKPPCIIQCVQTETLSSPQKSFQTEQPRKAELCCQTLCPPLPVHRGQGQEPPSVICVQTCSEPPPFGFSQTEPNPAKEECSQTVPKPPSEIQSQTDPLQPKASTCTDAPSMQENCDQTENKPQAENFAQTEKPCAEAEDVQTLDLIMNFSSQIERPCTKDEVSQKSNNLAIHDAQTSATPCSEEFSQIDPLCMTEVTAQTCSPPAEAVCAQTEAKTAGEQTAAIPGCEGFAQTVPPCSAQVCAQTIPRCLAIHCVQTAKPCPAQACAQTPVLIQAINSAQTDVAPVAEIFTQVEKSCPHGEYGQTESPLVSEGNAQTDSNNETTETVSTPECEGSAQTEIRCPKEGSTQSQENSHKDAQTHELLHADDCAQVEGAPTADNAGQTCPPHIVEECAQTEQNQESAQTEKEEVLEGCVQTEHPCQPESPAQTISPECVGRSDQTNQQSIQEGFAQTKTPCPNDYFTQTCSPSMLEALAQAEFINNECIQTEIPCGTQAFSQTCATTKIIHCVQTAIPCPANSCCQTPKAAYASFCVQATVCPLEGSAQTTPPYPLDQCAQTFPPDIVEECAQTEIKTECEQTEEGPKLEGFAQTDQPCPVDAGAETPQPIYDFHCAQTEKPCPEDKSAETPKIINAPRYAQTQILLSSEKSPQTEQPCPADEPTQTCSPESIPEAAQTDLLNFSAQTDAAPVLEAPAQTELKCPAEASEQTCAPPIAEEFAQTEANAECSQTESAPTLEGTTQISPCAAEKTSQISKAAEDSHSAQTMLPCLAGVDTQTAAPVVSEASAQGEYNPECSQTEPICAVEGPSQTEAPCAEDRSYQTCSPEVVEACAQIDFTTESCQTEITAPISEAVTQTELPSPCEGFSQTCRSCRAIRCTQTCTVAVAQGFSQTLGKCHLEQVAQTEQLPFSENCAQTLATQCLVHCVQTKPICPLGQFSQTDPPPQVDTSIQTLTRCKVGTPAQTENEIGESTQTEKSTPCEGFTQTNICSPAEITVQTELVVAEQCNQTVSAPTDPNCCQTEIMNCCEVCPQTEGPKHVEICAGTELITKCGQSVQSDQPSVDTTCTQIMIPEICTQTCVPIGVVRCAQTLASSGTHKCSQSILSKEGWSQREEPEVKENFAQAYEHISEDCSKSIQTPKPAPRSIAVDCCPRIHTRLNSCQATAPVPTTVCCSMQTPCCKPMTVSVVCSCPDIRTMKDMQTGENQHSIRCTSMQTHPSYKPKTFSVFCGDSLPNEHMKVADIQTCPTTCCTLVQTPVCHKPKTTSIECGEIQPYQQTKGMDIQTWALNPTCCTTMQTPICIKTKTISVDCGNDLPSLQTRAVDMQTWALNTTCCTSMQTPRCCKLTNTPVGCSCSPSFQQPKMICIQTGANTPGICCKLMQTPLCCQPKSRAVDYGITANAMDVQTRGTDRAYCSPVEMENQLSRKHEIINVDCDDTHVRQQNAAIDTETGEAIPSICCRTMQTSSHSKPKCESGENSESIAKYEQEGMDTKTNVTQPAIRGRWMQKPFFDPTSADTGSSAGAKPCLKTAAPTLITMLCQPAQVLKSEKCDNASSVGRFNKISSKISGTQTLTPLKSQSPTPAQITCKSSFQESAEGHKIRKGDCPSPQQNICQDYQTQYIRTPNIVCTPQQTLDIPCRSSTTQYSPSGGCKTVNYPSATKLQHLVHKTMRNLLAPPACVATNVVSNASETFETGTQPGKAAAGNVVTPAANVYAEHAILKALGGCPETRNPESKLRASRQPRSCMKDIIVQSSQVSLVGDILTERALFRAWKEDGARNVREENRNQATSPMVSTAALNNEAILESELPINQSNETNVCPRAETLNDRLAKIKTEIMILKESLVKEGIGNLDTSTLMKAGTVDPPEVSEEPSPQDKDTQKLERTLPSPPAKMSRASKTSKCPSIFKKKSKTTSSRKVTINEETSLKKETVSPSGSPPQGIAALAPTDFSDVAPATETSSSSPLQTINPSIQGSTHNINSTQDPFESISRPVTSRAEETRIPPSKSTGFAISDGPDAPQSSTQVLMQPKYNTDESHLSQLSPEEQEDQEAIKSWVQTVQDETKKKQEIQNRLKNVKEQVDQTREELARRGIIHRTDPNIRNKDPKKQKKK